MTSTRTLLTFMAPAVLWLAGCAAGPGGWGSAPGNTQHEYEAAQRGLSPVRVIVREGPLPNIDGARSPEELARDEAGQQCGRASLEANVLDVQRQRWPGRDATGGMTQFERVRLTFRCERGRP